MAAERWPGSRNMLKISDRVDGASVAPATPISARLAISISALIENAASSEATPKAAAPIMQQPAAADAVAERAHGDQGAGDQEAVDVDDPQQLGAAGLEVRAEARHRQVQHGQVHGIKHARQGKHGEPNPLAAPGPGWSGVKRGFISGVVFRSLPSHTYQ